MARSILIKPIISEKADAQAKSSGKYGFVVDKKANKIEVKKAVEAMYGITVADVNTAIIPGKVKSRNTRSGITKGRSSSYKKAFVTLAAGEEIDFFGAEEEPTAE